MKQKLDKTVMTKEEKITKFSLALSQAFDEACKDDLKPYEIIGLIEMKKLIVWGYCVHEDEEE
jgi:hypothetical protein